MQKLSHMVARTVAFAIALLLSACGVHDSSEPFTRFGIRANADSAVVLHELDANFNPTTYLGALRLQSSASDYIQSGRNQIEVPTSIANQLNQNFTVAQPIRYSISQIQNTSSDGTNWYWRAPLIYASAVELDSITTVTFEMITMLANQNLWNGNLSRQNWEAVYASAFRSCEDCTLKPVPEVAAELTASVQFLDQVAAILATPPLNASNFSAPATRAVYWYPGNLASEIKEGNTLQVFNYFWSLNAIRPLEVAWSLDGVPSAYSGPAFTWQVPYDADGPHTVRAEKIINADTIRKDFAINVVNVNQNPRWSTMPILQRANTILSFDLRTLVVDPDADELSFELSSGPSGAILINHTLTLSPLNADVGVHTLTLYTDDGNGSRMPASITWTVSADDLPVFTGGTPTTWALNEGVAGNLVLSAIDGNGDTFIVECFTNCPTAFAAPTPLNANILANATLSPGQHQFTLTPDYQEVITSASRTSPMQFKTKYTGLNMNQSVGTVFSVSVTITNIDDPPVWAVAPVLPDGIENSPYSYLLQGNDPSPASPGALSFSCPTKPAWMTVNAVSGLIGGTPGFTAATGVPVDVVCRVTDVRGLFAETTTVIEVLNTNRPLTNISPIPNPLLSGGANAKEGVPFSYDISVHFSDPDKLAGDPLDSVSYLCANCPPGMALGSTTGVITWTPGFSQSGTFNGLRFSVRDIGGLQYTSDPVSIIVENTEGPPLVSLSQTPVTVAEGSYGSIDIDVNHSLGDSYNYEISYVCTPTCPAGMVNLPSNTGVFGDAAKPFEISPDHEAGNAAHPVATAVYNIVFKVAKQGAPALSTTQTLAVVIQNTNRNPTDILFNGAPSTATDYVQSNDGYASVTNTVYLAPVDLDGTNDKYTFSVPNGQGFIKGTGATLRWEFSPQNYGCWPGGLDAKVLIPITMADGRGGSVTRNIDLNVAHTAPQGSPCPY